MHDGWDWSRRHPVLRLSFGSGNFRRPGTLAESATTQLEDIGRRAGVAAWAGGAPVRFRRLLEAMTERAGRRVVVLVDEYDKPILDALDEPDLAKANRDDLRGLYGTIKDCDAYVELTFITGVSRFFRVRLFSDLNNLIDLTVDPDYSAICGYTEADLDAVFAPELPGLDRNEIRAWYNGYSWLGAEKVYNPFGLLKLFRSREFEGHWFETATPRFLVDTLISRSRASRSSCEVVDAFGATPVEVMRTSCHIRRMPPRRVSLAAGRARARGGRAPRGSDLRIRSAARLRTVEQGGHADEPGSDSRQAQAVIARVHPAAGVLANGRRPCLEAHVDRLHVEVVVGEAVPEDTGGLHVVDELRRYPGLLEKAPHRSVGAAFRRRPEAAPDATRRPPLDEARTVRIDDHEEAAPFEAPRPPLRSFRVPLGVSRRERLAAGANRALGAARPAPAAHRGTEVHDGLRVVRHAFRRGMGLRQTPQLGEGRGRRNGPRDAVPPREHALDVRVQDRGAAAVALGDDGGGRGPADARQRLDRLRGVGDHAAVLPDDDAGGPVQVPRSGVVAEAAPQVQHLVELRRRQRGHVREAAHEPLEVRDDRAGPRLLQHDLGDPDPVRRPVPLPRQVLAAVHVPPRQQAAREAPWRRAARHAGANLRRAHATPGARYAALARESRYRRPETTIAPRPSQVAASQKSHPTKGMANSR